MDKGGGRKEEEYQSWDSSSSASSFPVAVGQGYQRGGGQSSPLSPCCYVYSITLVKGSPLYFCIIFYVQCSQEYFLEATAWGHW
jgi:hypothetical protein